MFWESYLITIFSSQVWVLRGTPPFTFLLHSKFISQGSSADDPPRPHGRGHQAAPPTLGEPSANDPRPFCRRLPNPRLQGSSVGDPMPPCRWPAAAVHTYMFNEVAPARAPWRVLEIPAGSKKVQHDATTQILVCAFTVAVNVWLAFALQFVRCLPSSSCHDSCSG